MKKNYKTPDMKLVTIRPMTILTGSNNVPVDPTKERSQTVAESRRHDDFDWDGEY